MAAPDPSTARVPGDWTHLDVRANGIRLHVVEGHAPGQTGPALGRPLVLLLHGFGEFWWSWRHQLTPLATAGFRPIAVDLRGYGDSDKPPRGYDGWTLANDIDGLIRALGHDEAAVVGHADGGLGAWATATLHPNKVSRIAVLGSPHPAALRQSLLRNADQRKVFLGNFLGNQWPRFAERTLTTRDGAFAEKLLRGRGGKRWQSTDEFPEVVARYREAIQIPGVAYCTLEYRRWAFRSQFRPDGARFLGAMNKRLHIPVLAIRGTEDPYMFAETVESSGHWVDGMTHREVPGAGHYVHEERPDAVTRMLIEFLQQ